MERLDPVVLHHIVDTAGWPDLRPLQKAAVHPLMDGEDAILLAPTAGGKTEAATFPLLSAMREKHWTDPAVRLTRRAVAALGELRLARAPREVHPAGTLLVNDADATRWWTWAGYRANATLTASLGNLADPPRIATATLAERLADFDGALAAARELVRVQWGG